jgi:hypothetical protein
MFIKRSSTKKLLDYTYLLQKMSCPHNVKHILPYHRSLIFVCKYGWIVEGGKKREKEKEKVLKAYTVLP